MRWVGGILLVLVLMSGCGQKKETPQQAAPVQEAAASAALPELEQNKMFLTNRPEPVAAPDESFEPVPEEQEPLPADHVENLTD